MIQRFIQEFWLRSKEAQDRHDKRLRLPAGVNDFVEYKYVLGLINGLEEADKIIEKLYKGTPEGIEKDNREREFNGEEPKFD